MKKILFTLLTLMLLVSSVNAQNRKRVIDPDNLPKPAVQLIQQHWPSCAIDFAYINGKEYEALLTDGTIIQFDSKGIWKEYEALLTDGTIIQFDSKGIWKEMKCTDGLPVTLVPGYITRYIVGRFPKQLIIDCEKIKGGYEVTLTNGLEIQFDLRGNVTHVDE